MLTKGTTALRQLHERGIVSVYAKVTEDNEGRQTLTIQHQGQSSNNDNTDGDVRAPRGRMRPSSRVATSMPWGRCPPQVAPSKGSRWQSKSNQTVHRQSKDDDDHSKQQKNKDVHLRCSLPLRPQLLAFVDVGREMVPARTWHLNSLYWST